MRHVAGCASCACHLGQVRATVSALADHTGDALSAVTRARILAAFRARRRGGPAPPAGDCNAGTPPGDYPV